jgi:hypothetical protein
METAIVLLDAGGRPGNEGKNSSSKARRREKQSICALVDLER